MEVLNNQLLTYPHEQKGCPCDKAHRLRDNWGESHPSLAEEKSTHCYGDSTRTNLAFEAHRRRAVGAVFSLSIKCIKI